MATTSEPSQSHDRHARRRPFATWMKRLAALKPSLDVSSHGSSRKQPDATPKAKHRFQHRRPPNNPYPASGTVAAAGHGDMSRVSSTVPSNRDGSLYESTTNSSRPSIDSSNIQGSKSIAPTVSTNAGTFSSDYPESHKAYSVGGMTTATAAGALSSIGGGGGGSTFSSPAPSLRSLTTTLTTIQSTAPSAMVGHHVHDNMPHATPAPAIPPHLLANPTTYTTATANNLLTDNASILTLASSSKRRRRRSMDTDASVRALAPSSLWGGSRESLPLSVLSAHVGDSSSIIGASSSVTPLPSRGNPAVVERASLYSVPGVISALGSERNSYHGVRPVVGDGVSVKSGIMSHGRNDSFGGISAKHTTNARDIVGRSSRRGSDWAEVEEAQNESATEGEEASTVADKGKGVA